MVKWLSSNLVLIKAWGLTSIIICGLSAISDFMKGTYSITTVSILEILFVVGYCLFILSYLRGKRIQSLKFPYEEKEINAWGYTWRSLIIILLVSCIWVTIIIFSEQYELLSLYHDPFNISFLLFLTLMPIITWLIFCPNRREILRRLVSIIRSY